MKQKKPSSVTWLAETRKSRVKWAETELNRRHKDFQSFALPTELSALKLEHKVNYNLKFYKEKLQNNFILSILFKIYG